MNAIALAGAALLALALPRQEAPTRAPEPLRPDETVHVELVSKHDEPELFDVIAYGAPAFQVLNELAKATGRELRIEPGETSIAANTAIDVHLRRRPLAECGEWIAGSAGLLCDVVRNELRLRLDRSDDAAPDEALRRAIDGWKMAYLRDPLHVDAPRLRFQIGNAYFQLGDFHNAVVVWKELEESAKEWRTRGAESADPAVPTADAEFGDLPLVYYRCGFAYQALKDEVNAQNQWLTIVEKYDDSPIVADARLQTAKSFRRQGDHLNANMMLRLVVEGQSNLSPANLIDAGELLNEGGSHERAAAALELALRSTSDPELQERGGVALARSKAGVADWHGVVAAADHYVRQHGRGRHADAMWLLLAEAHFHLADPFTALLALRSARELHPTGELEANADLLEGRIWAASGLLPRAEPCLARAGESGWPEIAAPALLLLAQLLREDGQYETAARTCSRLKALKGHEVEASVVLARIFELQRNRTRCLALVRETLPLADEAQRAELNAIAADALRDAPPEAALSELTDAPRPAPTAPSKEPADGR